MSRFTAELHASLCAYYMAMCGPNVPTAAYRRHAREAYRHGRLAARHALAAERRELAADLGSVREFNHDASAWGPSKFRGGHYCGD